MTELVQRLRRTVYRNGHYKDDTRVPVNPDGPEAADRIEALEAENMMLREAMRDIILDLKSASCLSRHGERTASAALGETK